ncbi:hypothetical protein NMY22_g15152 [Coprinellus aureogranulatus]|nr:hypothetical protein NMY22_g15152 [Coprinellus aureogranulatus]
MARSLECPFASHGCTGRLTLFKSRSALTNHIRTHHRNANIVLNPSPTTQPGSPAPNADIHLGSDDNANQASVGGHLEDDERLAEEGEEGGDGDGDAQERVPKGSRRYHPTMTGHPTDERGVPLPPGTPPLEREVLDDDWAPFQGETDFRLAEFLFRDEEMSQKKIDYLLELWALDKAKSGDLAPFSSYNEMYSAIDAISQGDAPWRSFDLSYGVDEDHPADTTWKKASYEVWYRDPAEVIANLLDNPDFDGQFDYRAYVELDKKGERRWSDFMSGNFAWRHSTQIYEEDNSREGSMLCPIVLGADKTTVSVATGHVEYHPLYLSIGNVHNTLRRAHRGAVIPIGFLAIPKSDRKYDNDVEFRKFKRVLYHKSITRILSSLRPGMTEPVVLRCPDGHYRRVIFELASFIADYPEQVTLAGVVQGWCTRCTGSKKDLDGPSGPRTRFLSKTLIDKVDGDVLWDAYGLDNDVLPFTHHFPRADIHEILTPDLLHQVIKGTFKDHLVTWVGEYLTLEHGAKRADEILDDIDRRIAATPSFPALCRFPHGRRFKQWTGDDSKALMKVYLPAIQGHVPDSMVRAISAFLDFCYLARRADITESTLRDLDNALQRFYLYREAFRESGVRPNGFSLPRQHALSHYRSLIEDFGAPGGLCSSITESRHITAVKRPWRRSNRYQALGQMLLTNQRLDKISAARAEFVRRGLLNPTYVTPVSVGEAVRGGQVLVEDGDGEWEVVDDGEVNFVQGTVALARKPVGGSTYPKKMNALGHAIGEPHLAELARRFLYDQLSDENDPDNNHDSATVPLSECPIIGSDVSVFHSASSTFYAPSDESGRRGMKRERIRSVPSWRKGGERRDCALVTLDSTKPGLRGMGVVRVRLLFSFVHGSTVYPCALVEWFKRYGSHPDSVTGMWRVVPEYKDGHCLRSVIHLDTFLRGVHLLPAFGPTFLPTDFDTSKTLSSFAAYYVNKFADHHSHEIIY